MDGRAVDGWTVKRAYDGGPKIRQSRVHTSKIRQSRVHTSKIRQSRIHKACEAPGWLIGGKSLLAGFGGLLGGVHTRHHSQQLRLALKVLVDEAGGGVVEAVGRQHHAPLGARVVHGVANLGRQHLAELYTPL
eukprot:218004-Chlamydomonas_euryale.AAC.1